MAFVEKMENKIQPNFSLCNFQQTQYLIPCKCEEMNFSFPVVVAFWAGKKGKKKQSCNLILRNFCNVYLVECLFRNTLS